MLFTAIFETHGWFPHCFGDVIAFPLDVVLISSASFSVIEDGFDLTSLFIIVNVRWWLREVGSMSFCFGVRHQEGSVEHIGYLPDSWQFQSKGKGSHNLFDLEGAFSFRSHFLMIVSFEVLGVKPYLLFDREGFEVVFSLFCHSSSCDDRPVM